MSSAISKACLFSNSYSGFENVSRASLYAMYLSLEDASINTSDSYVEPCIRSLLREIFPIHKVISSSSFVERGGVGTH